MPRLMLVAPSIGFGGGIERIAREVQTTWGGPVVRLDLYHAGRHQLGQRQGGTKITFAGRVAVAAWRWRPSIVLTVHIGLLPVAVTAARLVGARSALFIHGAEVWGPMSRARAATVRRCGRVVSI